MDVHSSIFHSGLKVEATPNQCLRTADWVHDGAADLHDGIFSSNKDRLTHPTIGMSLKKLCPVREARPKNPQKNKNTPPPTYDTVPFIWNIQKRRQRLAAGMIDDCRWTQGSFWDAGVVLKLGRGAGRATLEMRSSGSCVFWMSRFCGVEIAPH